MDWLTDHPALAWLGLALVLGAVEVATLDLFFLMLALGALAAAVVAGAFGAGLVVQVAVLCVVALLLVGVLRPLLLRRLRSSTPSTRTGTAALVGRDAVVLQTVSPTDGRVRLHGEVWSARVAGGSRPDSILPGQSVRVVDIEGATAIVAPAAPEPEN